KDALFQAIAETFTEDARARVAGYIAETHQSLVEDVLRNFVTRIAENIGTHRGLFRAIIERGFDHPSVMIVMFALREEIARALEDVLRANGGDAEEIGDTVRTATQMIYGFLLIGILNPRAPTRQNTKVAVTGLAD